MIYTGIKSAENVTLGDANIDGVYLGAVKVFPVDSGYDETKITMVWLDENDQPQETRAFFDNVNAVQSFLSQLTQFRFLMHIGNDMSITSISGGAFQNYSNLIIVELPNGLTEIQGNDAFYNCVNLKKVKLPNALKTIGQGAFRGCTSLTGVHLPNSLETIGYNAFRGCTSLDDINIPNSVTTLDSYAFYGTSITTVTIPASATVYTGVFENCTSLANADISSGVSSMGTDVFRGCTALQTVSIPSTLHTIPGYMFGGCTALQSIGIPSSVQSITATAFYACTALTSISIDKPQDSISGAPWGATNATVTWTG